MKSAPPPKSRVKLDSLTLAKLYNRQLEVVHETQSKVLALNRSPRSDSASVVDYTEAIETSLKSLFDLEDRIKGVRPGSAASFEDVAAQIQAKLNAIDDTIAKP